MTIDRRRSVPLARTTLAALCALGAGAMTLARPSDSAPEGPPTVVPQPRAGDPLPDLTPDELSLFLQGQGEFAQPFTEAEGLGPIFNEVSCSACHTTPIGGSGTKVVTRFGRWDAGVFDPLVGRDPEQPGRCDR